MIEGLGLTCRLLGLGKVAVTTESDLIRVLIGTQGHG